MPFLYPSQFGWREVIPRAAFLIVVLLIALLSGCAKPQKPALIPVGEAHSAPYGYTEMCKRVPEHDLCKTVR